MRPWVPTACVTLGGFACPCMLMLRCWIARRLEQTCRKPTQLRESRAGRVFVAPRWFSSSCWRLEGVVHQRYQKNHLDLSVYHRLKPPPECHEGRSRGRAWPRGECSWVGIVVGFLSFDQQCDDFSFISKQACLKRSASCFFFFCLFFL